MNIQNLHSYENPTKVKDILMSWSDVSTKEVLIHNLYNSEEVKLLAEYNNTSDDNILNAIFDSLDMPAMFIIKEVYSFAGEALCLLWIGCYTISLWWNITIE